ncbi:hypothetical protein D1B33_04150 [Lysinibacillus yapensis]|uniref:Uncharacterized protein n=1 Tax=Ureibacillus yapensis TaxID=2304605 RepID=A0A396SL00_9BACL|nr:hypothetical protein [Lysinibacillus yapensis]RHW40049.1 hypothetical protein D1B33_04150 [Lysinibacillus yapensis]
MIKKEPEIEEFIDTLENSHIYKDIRSKYEEITDGGKNRKSEHDEIVIRYGCEKYNLTTEELDRIFIDTKLKISEFQLMRKNKVKE